MSDPRPGRTRPTGRTPAGLPSDEPGVVRPGRPLGVEIAAALLVTTGAISTLTTIEATLALAARNDASAPLAVLSLAIGVGALVVGILVRTGRAWLLAVNLAAVAGFLELSSATIPGFLFGGMDVLVVVLLMRERPWFFWRPPGVDEDAGDGDDA